MKTKTKLPRINLKDKSQNCLCKVCKQKKWQHIGEKKYCPDKIERPFIRKKITSFNGATFEPMSYLAQFDYYINKLRTIY